MEKTIIFKLTSQYYIKIILPCFKEELIFCDDVSILFIDKNNEYLLYDNDTILWALRCLSSSLEATLQEKLNLPEFLKDSDIGYMWNKTIHDTLTGQNNKSLPSEWQDNYLIWNFKEFALWLYNKDNSIFLEVTPVYKWHFSEPESDETYLSYKQFMNQYKPSVILEIDKKIAQTLLLQSENLLQFLQENETRPNH